MTIRRLLNVYVRGSYWALRGYWRKVSAKESERFLERMKKPRWKPFHLRQSKTRSYLFSLQDGKCNYCGITCSLMPRHRGDRRLFTIDHVIPLSKGGTNALSNLRGSCSDCNNLKGDGTYADIIASIARRQRKLHEEKRTTDIFLESVRRRFPFFRHFHD